MKVGDVVRLKPDSYLRERLAPFADEVGCVVDTCQVDDDDGLRVNVRFPDQLYGWLAPLSADEFVVDLRRPDEPF
ncbi:MAG: hypothetical protein ACRYGP_30455 [Janthinobacterium lividum]